MGKVAALLLGLAALALFAVGWAILLGALVRGAAAVWRGIRRD